MDSQPRLYSMDSLKRISERSVPSPTDSLLRTMGHYRPSLVWLFDHIRRGENTTLSKEDLQQLLGSSVDSAELDEAFDNLDIDGDGEISLDDFLAGFARFLKEAPDTPGYDKSRAFSFLPQFLSPRHSRMHEEQYETKAEPDAVNGVSEPPNNFQMSLALLSANNRQSIESLWKSLAVSNPELLGDFEDFVAEISNEVEGAQRALEKQRKATKQEAIELDEEIESRLLDANTKLQIQTALVRQHTKAKVEQHLVMKEMELVSVRQKLEELESEMKEGQKVHMELEQQVVELHKEKEELVVKLEMSETQLRERQSVLEDEVATAHTEEGGVVSKSRGPGAGVRGQGMEVRGQGAEAMREEEGDLLRLKREYEEEIAELKAQLQSYQIESEDEELTGINGSSPDTQGSGSSRKRRPSGCSLMDEIVKTEGAASPILRGEPFISSSFRSSPLSAQRRTSSLPDLARAGLGNGSPSLLLQLPTTIYVPVYVRDPQPTATSLSPDPVAAIPPPAPSDLPHGHKVPLRGVSNGAPLDEALELPAMRRRAMTSPCGGRVSAGVQVQLPAMLEGQREEEEDEVISDEEDSFAEKCQPLEFIESLATPPDYVFKILVVGNSYVGKSSFLMRLCTNAFSARYSSTIGVDFYSKALRVDDRVISLQLWDTAGQERFQSVTKAYYRGAQGVILMYDISQEESFIAVKSWISSIQENVEQMPPGMLLVGNKQDLEDQNEREVSTDTGETFARIYGANFLESSAKTGYNVGNALLTLVRSIKRHCEEDSGQKKSQGVSLSKQQTGSRCCGR